MKLNPDCMRAIMLYLEQNLIIKDNSVLDRIKPKDFDFNSEQLIEFTKEDIFYSINQLFLDKMIVLHPESNTSKIKSMMIIDITPKGHTFLDSTRDKEIWNEVKKQASKIGITTLKHLVSIAEKVVTNVISNIFTSSL